MLQLAVQERHWEAALRLGRAVEGPLAVRGHWGAWAKVLELELEAARELRDSAAQAWSLHQSGTRALCLEDAATACSDLSEALRLREVLGDREGAAVTRHNLDLLGGLGEDHWPEGDGGGGGGSIWSSPGLWLGVIALVSVLTLLIIRLATEEPTLTSLTLNPSEVRAGETVLGRVALSRGFYSMWQNFYLPQGS